MNKKEARKVNLFLRSKLITAIIFFAVFFMFFPSFFSQAQSTSNQNVQIINLGEDQVLNEDYTFLFESSLSNIDFIELRFVPLQANATSKLAVATPDSASSLWKYHLAINGLENITYRLETAAVLVDGTVLAGQTRRFSVDSQTTIKPQISLSSPAQATVLQGEINFLAQTDRAVNEDIIFKVYNSSNLLVAQPVVVVQSGTSTKGALVSNHLPDGEYRAIAEILTTPPIKSAEKTFYINNDFNSFSTSTNNDFSVNFISPKAKAEVQGKVLLQVATSPQVESVYFRIGKDTISAQAFDNNRWQTYINVSQWQPGDYQIVAVAVKGEKENHSSILPLKFLSPPASALSASNQNAKQANKVSVLDPVTGVERNNTVATETTTQEVSQASSSEEELVSCFNEGIRNITCQTYLKNKENFSPECVTKVLDIDKCLQEEENLRAQCSDIGFTDLDLCRRYLTEPRVSYWCDLPEFSSQPVCQRIEDGNSDSQREQMISEQCRRQGIYSAERCQRFKEIISLPEKCQQQKIFEPLACRTYLQTKDFVPWCEKNQAGDEQSCRQILADRFLSITTCQDEDCHKDLQEKHYLELSLRANKIVELEKIRNRKVRFFNRQQLQEWGIEQEFIDQLPVRLNNNKNIRLLQAEEKIKSDSDQLLSPLPAVIVLDQDGDQLPDDIERRLGTDIFNPDTDGDGYEDGQEVLNGYDPNEPEKKLAKRLAPVEIALINQEVFEHALVSGSEGSDLSVDDINNNQSPQGGIILGGQAPAYSVVTLYIYSDLPLLITVQTDEYGRWEYLLEDSLQDGQHQVFVALNDDTGRIEQKSLASFLFINEAQAATVDDFFQLASAQEAGTLEKYYLEAAAALILLAVAVFLMLRFRSSPERKQLP